MRRTITLISAFALMLSMLALPAVAETNTVEWKGHGSDNLPCEGGYHWILAPGGGTTTTPLFFSSEHEDGQEMFRMSANAGDNAAWHFNSGLVDLEEGATPYVTFEGTPKPSIKLTISNCLDGDDEPIDPSGTLDVSKDAETSYDLEHEWDIDKVVDTENEHELEDGTPKIWLYTDGRGDEKATWTVDVTYEGATPSDIMVWGEILVGNSGPYAAVEIDSVEDVITQEVEGIDVDTTADVECFLDDELVELWPVRLEVGEELVCTYDAELDDLVDGVNTATVEGTFLYSELDPDDFNVEDPFSDEAITEEQGTATAPVEFGDPDDELYKTVNVKDISDLFGEEDLGEVTAPNGDTFTYDKDFAYADYGDANCGSHRYDNTATIVETEQDADATLAVNVQCLDWESAWAMGTGPEVNVTSFCSAGFSNWGWTNQISRDYEGAWPLYAGAGQCDTSKGTLVGTFSVSHNGGFHYEFNIDEGLFSEGGAVYADFGPFPLMRNGKPTTAPGQYYVANPLADTIHVIAHINVGIPEADFGPDETE